MKESYLSKIGSEKRKIARSWNQKKGKTARSKNREKSKANRIGAKKRKTVRIKILVMKKV
ncbi:MULTISPECIES: hypothetical protein [Methanosarcina]|uniref:hypothetical protein n=1 Tax=Methanosarcina TaxID=2207 RepID=UPI000AC32449|nr:MULTISPECIES: hypothetical protein [Methanosarcina]